MVINCGCRADYGVASSTTGWWTKLLELRKISFCERDTRFRTAPRMLGREGKAWRVDHVSCHV